ncbi:F-box domain-containing protein [Meloidogyne graminicola]|uniref:F-box domain-containing protein n=1 Tax=Meloidogyne graminicola TaxID=189291 RepID=A0A8S9ZU89_9BILA|nr:F-box domain-containing protein [Meloidogyne graminicola]
MEYLPPEIQLKIFQNLSFDELNLKEIKLKPIDFPVNNQLKEKVFLLFTSVKKCFLNKQNSPQNKSAKVHSYKHIRYITKQACSNDLLTNEFNIYCSSHFLDESLVLLFYAKEEFSQEKNLFTLKLPLFPKSIEELKIIRYWLNQIARCDFEYIIFTNYIFNPEMIKLLFDNNEIIKVKCNIAKLFMNMNINFTIDNLIMLNWRLNNCVELSSKNFTLIQLNKHVFIGSFEVTFKKDYNYYLTKPELGVVYYPLNDQLLEKWQSAIDKQIPVFLFGNYTCPKGCDVYIGLNSEKDLKFKLPIYPKNIKELQIIRFWFEQLFRCSFQSASFFYKIFNQEMIKLLFENNNKNINFYIQKLYCIYPYNSIYKSQFEFIIDHLIITKQIKLDFDFINNIDERNNYLMKLLFNCGKRIKCIYCSHINEIQELIGLIVNWIVQKLCLILNLILLI